MSKKDYLIGKFATGEIPEGEDFKDLISSFFDNQQVFLDDLNKKRDKSEFITMLDVAQDVKESMTGGSVAVVGVGSVDRLNVLNNTVTPIKTTFLSSILNNVCVPSISNYSYNSSQPGSINFDGEGFQVIMPSTGQTGIFFSANVIVGETYCVGFKGSGFDNVRVYGSNKTTQIRNCTLDSDGYYTTSFTATETVIYLRVWVSPNTTAIASYCGIFLGSQYKPSYELKEDVAIKTDSIKDKSIGTEKCNFFLPSKNLFDKSKSNDGYLIHGTYGTLNANAGHSSSDFIEIEGGVDYVINARVNFAFYNSSKTYISGLNSNAVGSVIHSPSNAKYIRFSLADWGTNNNIKNTSQFEKGTVSTNYQSFEVKSLDTSKILVDSDNVNKTPLKWVSYGDSITAANNWQPAVSSYYNLIHTNKGIGGTTIVNNSGSVDNEDNAGNYFCNIKRIAEIPNDTELITIMGGTNDSGQSKPIGDLSYPFDSLTVKGALALMIFRIQAHIPNAKIVIMTPLSGRGTTSGQNMTEQVKNTINLTTEDYAKAIKEVANAFSIPVINVFGETGINQFNRATYIEDTVHPNQSGADKISSVVIGGLKSILN